MQGLKPYHHNKYETDELSESYEQQMLLEMQREANNDGEDFNSETGLNTAAKNNALRDSRLCIDTNMDSSDEDPSTLKSPVSALAITILVSLF